MGKSKRNKIHRQRDGYERRDERHERIIADIRHAEAELLRARRRAAHAAAASVNRQRIPSPAEQAEAFFTRPGDYYVLSMTLREADGPGSPGEATAQCVLKADEAQRDYLVEVLRQIRGAWGERMRFALTKAQQAPTSAPPPPSGPAFDPRPTSTNIAMQRLQAEHAAAVVAAEAREPTTWDLEQEAADMLTPDDMAPDVPDWRVGGPPDRKPGPEAELCVAHLDPYCKVCPESNDDLWRHPRDFTREELQAQLPGMTRAEAAAELGINPADIGGDIKHAGDLEVEQIAAELGLSPLDLMPIDMKGGGRAYAVKPRPAPPPAGRHSRPEDDTRDTPPGRVQ